MVSEQSDSPNPLGIYGYMSIIYIVKHGLHRGEAYDKPDSISHTMKAHQSYGEKILD